MNVSSYISQEQKTFVTFTNILFFVLFCLTNVNAQYNEGYVEIRAKGSIPFDYLNFVRGESRVNIRNTEKLTKKEREDFRYATNDALREIFANGDIYFNDPLTDYVRLIGHQLTANTAYEDKIEFYVSKSSEMNATSWQTGTIIVNIGLISQLENEAQLAFVLAHEIAHFNNQHPYKQYAQYIKSNRTVNSSELAKQFSQDIDYNLKYEIEADSIALKTVKKFGYDLDEIQNALRLLLHFEPKEVPPFTDFLSSDIYQLEPTKLCTFQQYRSFKRSNNSSVGHFSNSHIQTRLRSVNKLINKDDPLLFALKTVKDGRFTFERYLFDNAKYMAHFEVVYQSFSDANYLRSTFEALILLHQFPDNQYLKVKVAENFYYINYYNQKGILNKIYFDSGKIQNDDYAQLYCLINNLPKDELEQLIYGFIQESYIDYPTNETMLITMAKFVEQTKGFKEALSFYQKYVKLFPSGKHYVEAKYKLK
jgi:hypothetical protein